MLFNSYGFIFLYLPSVLLGFFLLARVSHAFAAGWLALASVFFYGYWNPAYIGLLLCSIICNYAFGIWIAKAGLPAAMLLPVPARQTGAAQAGIRNQDSGFRKPKTVNSKQ